jgi:4-amino-4-deoxy-L-arabinose transferase-like glycosyltransferase
MRDASNSAWTFRAAKAAEAAACGLAGQRCAAGPFALPAAVRALGLFALLLRLPTLSSRSLWLDETYSAWFAAVPLHELWTEVPLYETHPPFYYTLLKAWSAMFGTGEAALRSLCVLASVLTVVLIPVCARRARLGARFERVALLAGLLLSVNANSIVYAQQARPYAIHALAGMLAVFFACMLVLALGRLPGPPRAIRPGACGPGWPAWRCPRASCCGCTTPASSPPSPSGPA